MTRSLVDWGAEYGTLPAGERLAASPSRGDITEAVRRLVDALDGYIAERGAEYNGAAVRLRSRLADVRAVAFAVAEASE